MTFKKTRRSKAVLDRMLWVFCDLVMTSRLSHFQKTMRISYTFHINPKIQTRQFQALFYMDLSKLSHASRKNHHSIQIHNKIFKIFTGSCTFWPEIWRHEYHIGQNGPKFIILQQIELEAWKLAPRWILWWRIPW